MGHILITITTMSCAVGKHQLFANQKFSKYASQGVTHHRIILKILHMITLTTYTCIILSQLYCCITKVLVTLYTFNATTLSTLHLCLIKQFQQAMHATKSFTNQLLLVGQGLLHISKSKSVFWTLFIQDKHTITKIHVVLATINKLFERDNFSSFHTTTMLSNIVCRYYTTCSITQLGLQVILTMIGTLSTFATTSLGQLLSTSNTLHTRLTNRNMQTCITFTGTWRGCSITQSPL